MEATIIQKVRNKDLFVYGITGTEVEIAEYRQHLGENYRTSDEGTPLFFTKFYNGQKRPLVFYKNHYTLEVTELSKLYYIFEKSKQNLWDIIDDAIAKDPRQEFKRSNYWALNKNRNEGFNSSIHKTPPELKSKLFEILISYGINIESHAKLNEVEILQYIEDSKEWEREVYEDGELFRQADESYNSEIDSWGEDWSWNHDN